MNVDEVHAEFAKCLQKNGPTLHSGLQFHDVKRLRPYEFAAFAEGWAIAKEQGKYDTRAAAEEAARKHAVAAGLWREADEREEIRDRLDTALRERDTAVERETVARQLLDDANRALEAKDAAIRNELDKLRHERNKAIDERDALQTLIAHTERDAGKEDAK